MPENENQQKQTEARPAEESQNRKIDLYLKEKPADPAQDEGVIDLFNILRYMLGKKRIYAFLTALLLLLGAAVPLVLYQFTATDPAAVAVLTYRYSNAEHGKAPDGSALNVSELKSSYILQKALDSVALSRSLSINDLAANLSIQGILTDESLHKLEVLETLSDSTSSSTQYQYYEELSGFELEYGNRYIVTLKNTFGKAKTRLSDGELQTLLQAIVSAYSEYFFETYARQTLPANALDAEDFAGMDYIEQAECLSDVLDTLKSYCKSKEEAYPDYRSAADGLSFADIASVIETTRRVNLDAVYSGIFTGHASRDPEKLLVTYNYYIRQNELSLQVSREKLAATQKLIGDYKNEQLVILSADSAQSQTSTLTTEYYNGLIVELMDISETIAATEKKLTAYRNIVAKFGDGTSATAAAGIEAELQCLYDDCRALYTLLADHTQELFDTSCCKNAYLGSLVTLTEGTSITSCAKKIAVFGAIGACAGLAVWFCDGFICEMKRAGGKADEKN